MGGVPCANQDTPTGPQGWTESVLIRTLFFSLHSTLASGRAMSVTFTVQSTNIAFLEHVLLTFSSSFEGISEEDYQEYMYDYMYYDRPLEWPQRGAISVLLRSPSGTTSTLLPSRAPDIYPGRFEAWNFLSLHFWGEDPRGEWTIRVRFDDIRGTLRVEVPQVTLYGTSTVPEAVSRIPQQCSEQCDPTRGCANTGVEFCDACAGLRVSSTLECVSSCPEGLSQRNGYCYDSSLPEAACEAVAPPSSFSQPTKPLQLLLLTLLVSALILNQN